MALPSKPASRHRLARAGLLILRLGLAAVFAYAAWTKLREPWMLFAISVDAYHVLPEWGSVAVARSLPWVELTLAVLLLSGLWKRVVMPAASVLLAAFFSLMVRSYVRGEGIDCGCFGKAFSATGTTFPLVRNLVLLVFTGILWMEYR